MDDFLKTRLEELSVTIDADFKKLKTDWNHIDALEYDIGILIAIVKQVLEDGK